MYDFSISKTAFFGKENGDETGRRSEQRGDAEKERKEKINWRIYETEGGSRKRDERERGGNRAGDMGGAHRGKWSRLTPLEKWMKK